MDSASFYNFCTVGYVGALFAYSVNLGLGQGNLRRLATVVTAIAFLFQTMGMLFRWIEAGNVEVLAFERAIGTNLTGVARFIVFAQHPPWSNIYEIMVFMAWGIVLVFLVSEVKWHTRLLEMFALIVALIALGIASLTDGLIKPLVPALKSWWIMIHVISASIAYSAGTIAAAVSLLYLIKNKDRVTLTSVASGVMAISALILFMLGRGSTLFATLSYRVKLLGMDNGMFVPAGRFVGNDFVTHYETVPFMGSLMLMALVACAIAAIIFYRNKHKDVPPKKICLVYTVAFVLTIFTAAWLCLMLLIVDNVQVASDVAAHLMPQGPWRVGFASNPWDLGLIVLILLVQGLIAAALWVPHKVRALLPEAKKLDRTAYANVIVAFSLVAVVLITGALWAHYAWGRYWAWDPKETGALMIWLTYAMYLHTRMTYGWSGVRSAVIGIFAFFIILAGFLGVNLGLFADGLHSYGST